ncbi:MAG: PHP domain-containing protein [Oscillospiraceae bacterium]|nr:PHP domain-containing protein [Oscillospiraceae bacterium]
MSFLFETHFHTPYTSSCGEIYPEESIPIYIENGYSGLVVTDHYYAGYFERLCNNSWREQADLFLLGYRKAKEFCEGKDFNVLLGLEIRFSDNCNDHLVYGMDEEFIYNNPRLDLLEFEKFALLCRENGFFLLQAHPFRDNCAPRNPEYLDGVEVYNGHPGHNSHNDKALNFAFKNNLVMTAGSDLHDLRQLCRAGMYLKKHPSTSNELASILFDGKIEKLKVSDSFEMYDLN